ncbi:Rv1733c family protein [Saccharothrix sp. Mg75]|uniref:Rv1733c family protein n=1 Tax=Saccharothrix sp. Mg75 TaxID=3445357 RepID=UPI003EEDE69E
MRAVVTRLVRGAFHPGNELAGRGDRLEGLTLLLLVLCAVLAVPVAAAIGSERWASGRAEAERQLDEHRTVLATLVEDAPAPRVSDRGVAAELRAPVRATWSAPGGGAREGLVPASAGVRAGGSVPVRVDADGSVVRTPLTREGAAVDAVALALGVWTAVVAVTGLPHLLVRGAHRALRRRRWEREWAQVAAEWKT